jgi:hypothetical protein
VDVVPPLPEEESNEVDTQTWQDNGVDDLIEKEGLINEQR